MGGSVANPDYMGAATAQGNQNQVLNAQQTAANRPNQYTPWGSSTWQQSLGKDAATGQPITEWTQTQSLNPASQNALESQQALQANRSWMGNAMLGNVGQSLSQPFDWSSAPAFGKAPEVQGVSGTPVQGGVATTGQQTALANVPVDTSKVNPTGQQMGVQNYGLDLSRPNQTTATTNEPLYAQQREQIANAMFNRMMPLQETENQAARTRMANMGLPMGSEAYNKEANRLQLAHTGAQYDALMKAGEEQQRMNQQTLGIQQQAFGQDVTGRQQQASAIGQQFGQGLQSGQFANQALQNTFGQGLQSQQAQNAAFGQQFGQNLQGGQFTNTALQNLFGQNTTSGEFANKAAGQKFQQDLAANQQAYSQQMQAAQYADAQRKQALEEQVMARQMPLNELNALLAGQGVQQGTMPSFQQAGVAAGSPYMQAAQGQGQLAAATAPQWGSLLGAGMMGLQS